MHSTTKSWLIALVGGLFFFYNFIQMTLLNPLAPAVMEAFHIDSTAFAAVNSGFFFAVALLALPGGMIADKFRTQYLLMGLTLATVLNLVITAHTTDIGVLGGLRFTQGMIHAFALTLPLKLAIQWIPAKRMAIASSLIITLGLLGAAISQPLMTYFVTTQGLEQTFMNNAYIGLAIFALFALVVRDNNQFWQSCQTPNLKEYFAGLRGSFGNSQNWVGGLYVFLLNLPLILLGAAWGQLYMEHTWALKAEAGSFVIGMMFMGVIVGSPLFGFISDSLHSRKRPMVVGSLLSMVVLLVLLFSANLSSQMLTILFFMLGVTSSSQVLVYPMVAECNSPQYVGTSLSIVTFVLMIGNAVGNTLFGMLIQASTIQTAWGPEYSAQTFNTGMWMVCGAMLVSAFVILMMKETFQKID
jgi:predicted MFS family arabinose efflux permease